MAPDLPLAPTPAQWLDTGLAPHLGASTPDAGWVGLDGLDRACLAALHAQHLAAGATGPAAAKWLVGWFPGGVAAAVGRTLALTGAALVVDPGAVRWRVHPDGWPDGLHLGAPGVVVAPDHPWAAAPGVAVVAGQQDVRATALASVVAVARPVVERFRGLAKVGAPALWAEVGDRLGLAVAQDPQVPVAARAADELQAVVALPSAPWRQRPALDVGTTATGPAYLGQKGGCCLAYQCARDESAACADGSWEALLRERFPERTAYCSTCSLLDGEECRARQRLWIDHVRLTPLTR